jgi:hypothetical protein
MAPVQKVVGGDDVALGRQVVGQPAGLVGDDRCDGHGSMSDVAMAVSVPPTRIKVPFGFAGDASRDEDRCLSQEGTMSATCWKLVVSQSTKIAVRQFLASQGGGRRGDVSRFVEEAVRIRILELTAAQAKAANADVQPHVLNAAIDEALAATKDSPEN